MGDGIPVARRTLTRDERVVGHVAEKGAE